jgi:hypothetical protein
MSDLQSPLDRPAGVSREMLLAIILGFVESSEPATAAPWRPGFFTNSKSRLTGIRIESLCRKIMSEYGPTRAPAFTSPAAGEDPVIHASQENAVAYEAFEAREKFKDALRRICESEDVFRLAPRQAVMDLLELRDLLKGFPESDP